MSPATIDGYSFNLGQSSELGLVVVVAGMMFSVALNLKVSDFHFLRSAPRAYLVGIFAQIVALPVITLGLCFVIEPSPSVALGMIVVSCCPGGNVSNILVLMARGNAALSVSLTATSSLLAAFITPFAILFWTSLYPSTSSLLNTLEFDASKFLLKTALILALPLIVGMLINHFSPKLSASLRQPLLTLSCLCLVVIIVVAMLNHWEAFLAMGISLFWVVILHNASAFWVGDLLARLNKLDVGERRALTYEVGIQNSGLALVILITQLNGLGGATTIIALWGAWHIIAGLTLAVAYRISDLRSKRSW